MARFGAEAQPSEDLGVARRGVVRAGHRLPRRDRRDEGLVSVARHERKRRRRRRGDRRRCPGSAATPSENFSRWALGVDLAASRARRPSGAACSTARRTSGATTTAASSSPIPWRPASICARSAGTSPTSRRSRRYGLVGLARRRLQPERRRHHAARRATLLPLDQTITTWSPLVGLVLPGSRAARLRVRPHPRTTRASTRAACRPTCARTSGPSGSRWRCDARPRPPVDASPLLAFARVVHAASRCPRTRGARRADPRRVGASSSPGRFPGACACRSADAGAGANPHVTDVNVANTAIDAGRARARLSRPREHRRADRRRCASPTWGRATGSSPWARPTRPPTTFSPGSSRPTSGTTSPRPPRRSLFAAVDANGAERDAVRSPVCVDTPVPDNLNACVARRRAAGGRALAQLGHARSTSTSSSQTPSGAMVGGQARHDRAAGTPRAPRRAAATACSTTTRTATASSTTSTARTSSGRRRPRRARTRSGSTSSRACGQAAGRRFTVSLWLAGAARRRHAAARRSSRASATGRAAGRARRTAGRARASSSARSYFE